MCNKINSKNLDLSHNHLQRMALSQQQNPNLHSTLLPGPAKVDKTSMPIPAPALQHWEVWVQGSQEVARWEEIRIQGEHPISGLEAPESHVGLLKRLTPIDLPKEHRKAKEARTAR
jgi:hypothetical protein